jgi:peptidyl-prolyl cis-trans isomerase SurA
LATLSFHSLRSCAVAAFFAGSSAAMLVLAPPALAQEVLDGIAAVVNDDVVTFSQVRELVGARERAAKETLKGQELVEKIKEIRLQAINDLIDRQLILQEFKKSKGQIPDHFIEDRIQTITREEFGGDRSAFIRTLAAQGYTLERFKQLETEKMIVSAMRSQMVKSDVIVPESRILSYYNDHRGEFTTEEQIKLRMIAIRKGEGSDNRRKLIEEIRQKIVDGAAFDDLAKMYSEDSTQDVAGDWGWINRKTLNESLTKAAFSLPARTCSPIIELGNSYYLLYVEEKRAASTKPLGEVHDTIEKKLIQEERQRRQKEWIEKLRKKAYIKMF